MCTFGAVISIVDSTYSKDNNKHDAEVAKTFDDYIESAYFHWIKTFGNYRKLKSSIHWTLGHVIQFISMNSGYSLDEMSENSVEATIKSYRYI